MKKVTSLLFILSLFINVNAQNWAIAQPDSFYFYQLSLDSPNPSDQYYSKEAGIKIESSLTNNNVLEQFFNKQLRLANSSLSCDSLTNNQFGKKYVVHANRQVLINKDNDSIFFPKTSVASWILHRLNNGSYYEAYQINTDTLKFKNNLDSIYQFKIRLRGSSGQPLNSNFNDTLSFSKHYGFLKTYNWYEFPDTNTYVYEQREFDLLTVGEVYDFEVNDEFHLNLHAWPANVPGPKQIIKILSRLNGNNQVTYYRFIEQESYSMNNSSIPPTISTQYSSFMDTVSYSQLDALIGYLPNCINPANHSDNMSSSNNLINNTPRLGYSTMTGPYFDSIMNCFHYVNLSFHKETLYIKGCGSYIYETYGQNGNAKSLVYYKKGNETWGQPTILTGIENNPSFSAFQFFPNPSANLITFSQIINNQEAIIRIRAINGKTVKSLRGFQVKQIDISDLANGIYLLELQNNSNIITRKLVINR